MTRRRFERTVDARYARQSYELAVPVPAGRLDASAIAAIATAFHERHRQTYGHDNRAEPVQMVTVSTADLAGSAKTISVLHEGQSPTQAPS